ncbi:MAG: hypothetical protein ABR563_02215, partial [Pyrinomonadaceae bacterium]
MKKRFSRPAAALCALALAVSFAFAQQTPPRRGEARTTPNPNGAPPARSSRTRLPDSSNATSALEGDFAEALSVVQ